MVCGVVTQALAAAGDWAGAVAKARQGAALAAGPHGRAPEFEALLDTIAIDAALAGSDAGFDGRRLQVTPACWSASACLQAGSMGGKRPEVHTVLKSIHVNATFGQVLRVQRLPLACRLQLSTMLQAGNLS